jgi:NAD(P)-dependent dehydrogenase (short-subunit alcohol dehydrogenase family)
MVINIASLAGEQGYPCSPVYASSKAAVVLLERVAEHRARRVRVFVRAVGRIERDAYLHQDRQGRQHPRRLQAGIARFFARNSSNVIGPAVTADVI